MKKIISTTILMVAIFGIAAGQIRQPEWYAKMKQIRLLTSTFSSVVELLGKPRDSESSIMKVFDMKGGSLAITLSTGRCGTPYKKGYDVEASVVERVSFYIDKESRVEAKKLGIKLSRFKKFEVHDVPGVYTYENRNTGVYIGTDDNGLVESITLFPSSEHKDLFCK